MTPNEFKEAQSKLGMTNAQAADALGVTKSAVEHWRGGVRPVPKFAKIIWGLLLSEKPKYDGDINIPKNKTIDIVERLSSS